MAYSPGSFNVPPPFVETSLCARPVMPPPGTWTPGEGKLWYRTVQTTQGQAGSERRESSHSAAPGSRMMEDFLEEALIFEPDSKMLQGENMLLKACSRVAKISIGFAEMQ